MSQGKVLVCGDWHEDWAWGRQMVQLAADNGADTIIHVGDFGVGSWRWPAYDLDPSITGMEPALAAAGVRLIFIDGNHDDHALLSRLDTDAHGMGVLSPHMRHARRGTRLDLEIAGQTVRAGFLGGAVSVDRQLLQPGVSWWAQEMTTRADVARLGAGKLDVLFTHDAPIPSSYELTQLTGPGMSELPLAVEADSRTVRELLNRAASATRPGLVVCGHWHVRASGTFRHGRGPALVEILDKERRHGNAAWLQQTEAGPVLRPALVPVGR